MKIHRTLLADLVLVETVPTKDVRGSFVRIFCESECASLRPNLQWTQINLSCTSQRGTIRGMHFQHPPAAEAKLIRCLRGCVFDVAVDLRAGSPTFMRWHSVELSEDNSMQIFIPEGFAHGFQTLTDDVKLIYLHTKAWNPTCESGVRYNDPALAIKWPLPVTQISDKDRDLTLLSDSFAGITL